jgi:hypothetical protein
MLGVFGDRCLYLTKFSDRVILHVFNEIFLILKAALEGALAKKIGTYVSLSEQELVDCSTTNLGCSGG